MPRKFRGGGIRIDKGTNMAGYVALSRLLTYAAREAAAQNRFTTAELIQDAIASLPDQSAAADDLEREPRGDGWPPLGRA